MAWLQADRNEGNGRAGEAVPQGAASPNGPNGSREKHLHEVKQRLHRLLVERLNVVQLENLDSTVVATEIRRAVSQLLAEDPFPLNSEERLRMTQDLEFEILGLGPLEPLVRDDTISDILVNRYDEVFIERAGLLEPSEVRAYR